MDDIVNICFGRYQMEVAKAYAYEHIMQHKLSKYDFFMRHETNHLIRVRIQSKHSNNPNKYLTFVSFQDHVNILAYCTCKGGNRTLGFCSHACSVIWYLGYGIYNITNMTPKFSPRINATLMRKKHFKDNILVSPPQPSRRANNIVTNASQTGG